ncbi:hypothetical protein Tco_0942103, partial [Tanacetum coccineum]
VITVVNTAAADVIPLQPRRLKKRKTTVSDAGGSSHPPKKLREDHETLSETIPTLSFVTSSVSTTPESKEEDHTDSLAGANLRTIGAPPSVPLMTMTTIVTSTVDPTTTAKEKLFESAIFGDGSSSRADHTVGGFSCLTGSDFIVGGIRTVVSPDTDIQKVYVPQWSVTNGSHLDDGRTCREMVDEFAPPREKGELDIKVADLAATVKVREQEVADLDAVVTSVKFHNDNLTGQVHKLEASSAVLQDKVTAYDNFIGQLEKFQDDRIREMNEKLNKLDADLVKLALHLEEKFYPHLLTTISGSRWLLTHGLELANQPKCLNLLLHIFSLSLSGELVLTDVAAYNPSAEADYLSALQRLQSVNFSLISEMKSNKDASVDTVMNLLCLEDSLTERSALYDVFVPLAEPLSIASLKGTASTSGTAPGTTTALSVTFASTSTIPPISTDDYEIVYTDDQEGTNADGQTGTGADANPFPSIDDAKLNVPE